MSDARRGLALGGLVRLALRRTFAPRFLAVLALLTVIVVTRDWGVPEAAMDEDAERRGRGFARQGVWTVLLLLVVPVLVHRATSILERWREGDAEWLASRPVPATKALLAIFLGTWLAAAAVLVWVAVLAEVAAGGAGPTSRLSAEIPCPSIVLVEGDDPVRWEPLPPPGGWPAGASLRLRPAVAPGSGPAVTLRATARIAEHPRLESTVRTRIFARRAVELFLPAGDGGTLELELAREGEGAILVLPAGTIGLLVPLASDRRIGLETFWRLLLATGGWIAVGLGLGTWLRPSLGALAVLALWFLPWWWGVGAGWIPGGDLPLAWGLFGEGLAPPLPAVGELAGLALLLGLGILAGRRGMRAGRSKG